MEFDPAPITRQPTPPSPPSPPTPPPPPLSSSPSFVPSHLPVPLPPSLPSKKDAFKEKLKALLSSFNKNVTGEYYEIIQLAGEKLGRAQITPFPQEFLDLEIRIENMKRMHQNLIKIASLQIYPASGTSTVNIMAGFSQFGQQNPSIYPAFASLRVSSLSPFMSIAEELVKVAKETGEDTPLGAALYAWAESQKKIGSCRLQMGMELHDRFVLRLAQNLDSEIATVDKYRRQTREARIKLDTLKGRVRSMAPNKAEQFEEELRTAQNRFTNLVEKSIELMRKALVTPVPLIALTEYMESMYNYFKSGYETLSMIAPELHALKGVEEKIFQPSPSSFPSSPPSSPPSFPTSSPSSAPSSSLPSPPSPPGSLPSTSAAQEKRKEEDEEEEEEEMFSSQQIMGEW